jgi:hypothetical protein
VTRPYFRAHRICDANSNITPETWEPLARYPAWDDADLERREWFGDEAVRLVGEAQARGPARS